MRVRVIHGANEARFDVAGKSVSDVRSQFRDQFNEWRQAESTPVTAGRSEKPRNKT